MGGGLVFGGIIYGGDFVTSIPDGISFVWDSV